MGISAAVMAHVSEGLTVVSTLGQVASQQQQAKAITSQSDFDAKLAKLNADDAIARWAAAASRHQMQVRGLIGSQRAALAAQGLDVSSGTALDLQDESAYFGELDAQTIRNNAAREAYGIQTNSIFSQLAARNTARNLRAQSFDTLLTGAGKTYGIFRAAKESKTTPATSVKAYGGTSGGLYSGKASP